MMTCKLGWLIVFCWVAVGWRAAEGAERPNIIVLLADDQRWDTLGVYGNSIIQTPHIDRLAGMGVTFKNAFVTTSICASSRASILTGQYVSRNGVWDFRTELTPEQLALTYPGVLKKAGYRLGFTGKWGVGRPPAGLFDYDKSFPGQGNYRVEVKGQQRHLTALQGDHAIEFLEGSSTDAPFCLSISFKAPHVQDSYDLSEEPFPFDPELKELYGDDRIPPPKTAAREYFDRLPAFLKNSENRKRWAIRFWGPDRYQESVKGYYRLISGIDTVVGRIVRKLADKKLTENTIILYTSDNGFYLGEYGLAGKWLPHEASVRVPFIVYDPRSPELQGTRRNEMVLNIDVGPTVLHLAGADVPSVMQGRSLLPLLEGKDVAWRTDFFYEHLFRHPLIPPTEAVRTERWKYIRYVESDPVYEELYDLKQDALEENNLVSSSSHAGVLNEMRTSWRRLREQAR